MSKQKHKRDKQVIETGFCKECFYNIPLDENGLIRIHTPKLNRNLSSICHGSCKKPYNPECPYCHKETPVNNEGKFIRHTLYDKLCNGTATVAY